MVATESACDTVRNPYCTKTMDGKCYCGGNPGGVYVGSTVGQNMLSSIGVAAIGFLISIILILLLNV
jgi:hypothetical protein